MKARIWKSTDKKVRIVERFNKSTAESLFDVQLKKHHMWITQAAKLTANELKDQYGFTVEGKPEV